MDHKDDLKIKAEKLRVEDTLSIIEIAQRLEIPAQTIYHWLAAVKDKEGFDWNEQRKTFSLSPKAMIEIYAQGFKRWIPKIQKDIDIMANPQTADAISKHISTLKKLDPHLNYLGAILNVIHISR